MKLSPHFSLSEFTVSRTAHAHGIDNTIPPHLQDNLAEVVRCLELTRAYLSEEAARDCPIIVTSGYRAFRLNRLVGGSDKSHHMQAAAVDWICPAFGSPYDCSKAVADAMAGLGWTQVIHEHDWIHCGVLPVLPGNEVLTLADGGYLKGIQKVIA